MKTRGCEVWEGYLAAGFRRADGTWTPSRRAIPDAIWARLKHAIARACRRDEFMADELRANQRVADDDRMLVAVDAEVRLFRLWVTKLGLDLPAGHYAGEALWPWSRGWTDAAVDSYLSEPARERAA